MLEAPPLYADRARAVVAELGRAAARGPVGPATILAATTRLHQLLRLLRDYEEAMNRDVREEQHQDHARLAAIQAGTVIALPRRPRSTGHGGTAA